MANFALYFASPLNHDVSNYSRFVKHKMERYLQCRYFSSRWCSRPGQHFADLTLSAKNFENVPKTSTSFSSQPHMSQHAAQACMRTIRRRPGLHITCQITACLGRSINQTSDSQQKRPSSSSTRWKSRQAGDSYAREAKVQGLKSRAAFKLLEVLSVPCPHSTSR